VTVFLLNERTKVREGAGLILKVVSDGPEPVYRVDGYLIRVNLKSLQWYANNLQRLSDVGPNSILHYKGKIGEDGILEATRANFTRIVDKPGTVPLSQSSEASDKATLSNGCTVQAPAFTEDKQHSWIAIPPDHPIQQRVARIGMSLTPACLCENTGKESAKINFRFYAIDDEKVKGGYAIFDKHVILIPKQAAERLQNDSQLAAVLAEGIAQTLQMREITKGEVGEVVTGAAATSTMVFAAPLSAIAFATELIPGKHKGEQAVETPAEDQRDRIALGLMADAGYDPHQAPEAWRLLATEHSTSDPQQLLYPIRSEYQLSVLATMYDLHTTPVSAGPQ
jgi:hypothetical protein